MDDVLERAEVWLESNRSRGSHDAFSIVRKLAAEFRALRKDRERLEKCVSSVRRIHFKQAGGDSCAGCRRPWPCHTQDAINDLEARRDAALSARSGEGRTVSAYNFGALPPLPDGYRVDWVEEVEHYMAFGPDEWESVITCDPHQARRWCFVRAEARSGEEE